jgi:hypothetical protein
MEPLGGYISFLRTQPQPFAAFNCNVLIFKQDNFESFLVALLLCDSNQLERISLHCNNLEAIQVTRFINALGDHHNLLA